MYIIFRWLFNEIGVDWVDRRLKQERKQIYKELLHLDYENDDYVDIVSWLIVTNLIWFSTEYLSSDVDHKLLVTKYVYIMFCCWYSKKSYQLVFTYMNYFCICDFGDIFCVLYSKKQRTFFWIAKKKRFIKLF